MIHALDGVAPNWIAVDWGTSRLRAFAMAPDGMVLAEAHSDDGMGRLKRDQFEGALINLIEPWMREGETTFVLACGMVGAQTGWIEAPYLDVPADLGKLAESSVAAPVTRKGLVVRILPGMDLWDKDPRDVMRGEETQLLGFASLYPSYSGPVCLPGTHSKWAELQGQTISRFQTFMTGELFEILTHRGLLSQSTGDEDWEDQGFEVGARAGLENPAAVTANLFRVRVNDVLGHKSKGWCRAWLSGLLIGTEVTAATLDKPPGRISIPLIGAGRLTDLYSRAFELAGFSSQVISGKEAVLAGLSSARTTLSMEAA